MGKIVYLMGKSSSGKDTIFKELMKEGTMDLRTIVPYTTRPIRAGEENGVEYFFTDEAGFQALKAQGKPELRQRILQMPFMMERQPSCCPARVQPVCTP